MGADKKAEIINPDDCKGGHHGWRPGPSDLTVCLQPGSFPRPALDTTYFLPVRVLEVSKGNICSRT